VKAVVIDTPGGPQVLRPAQVPDPVAGSGEVVVEVAGSGVNRADLLQRQGLYPPPLDVPPWPGLEVSGRIAQIGPGGGHGWQIGDQVCALLLGGGYAERVKVPTTMLLPCPPGIDLVDAASLPEAAATVMSALSLAHAVPGETLLIRGGSGGIGSLAVQIAAGLGLTVLATAGGTDRVEQVRRLGVEHVLDHRRDDLVAQVHEAAGRRGVDIVLDVLGAGGLADNLSLLADDGRLVVIGLQKGSHATLDLKTLLTTRASVIGTTLRSRPPEQRAAIVAQVREQVWPMLAAGTVHPVVHTRLPLSHAGQAHRLLASGHVFGKVILVPDHVESTKMEP